VNTLKLHDHLDDESKRKLNDVHRDNKKKEKLSDYDLKELMGVNRDKYHRVKGKVKRK